MLVNLACLYCGGVLELKCLWVYRKSSLRRNLSVHGAPLVTFANFGASIIHVLFTYYSRIFAGATYVAYLTYSQHLHHVYRSPEFGPGLQLRDDLARARGGRRYP